MSDSLRDQLMKAGFKDTTGSRKKPRGPAAGKKKKTQQTAANGTAKNKGSSQRSGRAAGKSTSVDSSAEAAAAKARKREIKEKIKTLIETNKIEQHSGTVAYNYQLGSRVKQLFVNEECQKKLADGDLLITRLNGNTYLIPPATGEEVLALNPDWALISADKPATEGNADDAYADYQVPDDLTW